jgi:hypothetical protein
MSLWIVTIIRTDRHLSMHRIEAQTSTEALMLALARTGLPSNITSVEVERGE